jgi:gamma-glutamylcyclotransferase (GGCT)/AIG2-like uncharacterized protein YtfP
VRDRTEPEFVFVYGSLMRGEEHHGHIESGSFAGEGKTAGVLVSLGRYPGLIDGQGSVRGELYRFADMPAALDVLDDFEEYDATDVDASIYVRVARPVSMHDGRIVLAWVYRYNRPAQGEPAIRDGDWRTPAR